MGVRTRVLTFVALVAAAFVIVGGGIVVTVLERPRSGIMVAYGFAVAALLVMVALHAIIADRFSRALRAVAAAHPDALVFLARRLPPVVSDLPSFLKEKGIEAEIGDGWYPTTAHPGGLTVWTAEAVPREVLTIEWAEIGDVLPVHTPTVGRDLRWCVSVDVKPYVIPLTVDVGYAWGVVTMALNARDTATLVEAVVAQRPSHAR